MLKANVDPRIQRTRKLIMDSFIDLSTRKDFKDITVKDITEAAMINRATFYYHFEDKYDLLDMALLEVLSVNLDRQFYEKSELNEETLINIFIAITKFQESIATRCHQGYEETIARIIRDQLELIIYKMLLRKDEVEADEALKLVAIMLSWGMYGASVKWRRNSEQIAPEEFIKESLPYILSGVNEASSEN